MSEKRINERMSIKSPFIYLLICGITGAAVVGLLGVLAFEEIVPKEIFKHLPKAIIGFIVLAINALCVWSIIYRQLYKSTDTGGKATIGIIEEVFRISNVKQMRKDEWQKDVRYCCVISYSVGAKKYRKEFPPTAYISPQELYPITIKEGGEIKLKYHQKYPRFCIMDIDLLKQRYYTQTKGLRCPLITLFIVTASYLLYVFYG